MRTPYWKRVYIRKNRTIWENKNNKKRVIVDWNRGHVSWKFSNYENITIVFNNTSTKNNHRNYLRNKKAAFEFAIQYMREHPR